MKSWLVIPGVPAGGHVTAGGVWHPGNNTNCPKCEPPKRKERR